MPDRSFVDAAQSLRVAAARAMLTIEGKISPEATDEEVIAEMERQAIMASKKAKPTLQQIIFTFLGRVIVTSLALAAAIGSIWLLGWVLTSFVEALFLK